MNWTEDDFRLVDAYIYEDGWIPDTSDSLRCVYFWLEFEDWRKERMNAE